MKLKKNNKLFILIIPSIISGIALLAFIYFNFKIAYLFVFFVILSWLLYRIFYRMFFYPGIFFRDIIYLCVLLAVFLLTEKHNLYPDKKVKIDKKMKIDIDAGRMAYDNIFNKAVKDGRIGDIDKAVKDGRISDIDIFINICDHAGCQVIVGSNNILALCNNHLSTSSKFHKYRVYICSIKITIENNQPMDCNPLLWKEFKELCDEDEDEDEDELKT